MALTVVTGPPAAGKSSWVTARAKPGDVVIDLDRIAQALSPPGADLHDYGRTLRTIAQQARRSAITEALKHCGDLDVYIVHTQPGPTMLRVYRQHGAQVVTVDPGYDVVIARCQEQRTHGVLAAVERWYSDHGRSHTLSQGSSRAWLPIVKSQPVRWHRLSSGPAPGSSRADRTEPSDQGADLRK